MTQEINSSKRLGIFLFICLIVIIVVGVWVWQPWNPAKPAEAPAPELSKAEPKATGAEPPAPPVPPVTTEASSTVSHRVYGGEYTYGGEPKATPSFSHAITVLTNAPYYVIGYCEDLGDPVWVAFKLHKVSNFIAPKRKDAFRVDDHTSIHVLPADYRNSGYDKGHMYASYIAGIMYGEDAQNMTYLMSNMTPQKPKLNQQILRKLEEYEVKTLSKQYESVWIIRGAIFKEPIEKLHGKVSIPSSIFEIWVREDNGVPKVVALSMGQDVTGKESFDSFLTSVDDIENETGLDFMNELPKEKQDEVEALKAQVVW